MTLRAVHNRVGDLDHFEPMVPFRPHGLPPMRARDGAAPVHFTWHVAPTLIVLVLLFAILSVAVGVVRQLHESPGHAADLLAGVFVPGGEQAR